MTSIDKIRPFMGFENDYFLSRTGSYSLGFSLELPPVFTMGFDDYKNASDIWSSIFKSLPEFTVVHKMDVFTEESFKPLDRDTESILYKGYKAKFNERKMMTHKSYVIFSKASKEIKNSNSYHSSIFKKKIVPKEFSNDEDFARFDQEVRRALTVLNDSKYFKLSLLKNEDWIKLCRNYESLNFDDASPQSTGEIFQDKQETKIGNFHISSVAINDIKCLPSEYDDSFKHQSYRSTRSGLSFSLFFPIGLELKGNHIVNQTWIVDTKESVKSDLRSKDSYSNLFRFADKSNSMNIADNSDFMELLEKDFTPVLYHGNIILWNTDIETLREVENKAVAAFNRVKITPNIASNEVLSLYWACYPGNIAELGAADQSFLILDKQSGPLNIYESPRGDDKSDFGIYLSDRLTGCPVFVDISDLPKKKGITNNSNKLVFGPSGSGKSMMCNTILENYLNYDVDVVIVDVGDSYERLNKLYGGTYLSYKENSPFSFNPFVLDDKEVTPEKKMFLNTLIVTLWKKEGEITTSNDDVFISNTITAFLRTVSEKSLTASFNLYYEFVRDSYLNTIEKKEAKKLKKLVDIDSFILCLEPFYKGGEYDYLLNSKVNTGLLETKFIIFELDNIKDNHTIFPIVTLMIMDTFISKLRSPKRKGRKKVILIEEAWKAIATPAMAKFLQYLFKTVRKLDGEAIIVTQEVEDILGNAIIKNAIIKNCGAKIIMDMKEYANSMDELAKMLSLSQIAIEAISSLNTNNDPDDGFYKEVFIGLGNSGYIYRNQLCEEQVAAFTTTKSEVEVINDYETRFGGDTEMAIQYFADDLKRN